MQTQLRMDDHNADANAEDLTEYRAALLHKIRHLSSVFFFATERRITY